MNARALLPGLMLLMATSAAVAAPTQCTPVFERGWIRAAPPGATMLAGYGELRNPCAKAFAVTGLRGRDFVMAMVHETRVDKGVSRMRHAKSTPLPARGTLRLAPGGHHFMLMHPKRPLPEGTLVKLDLQLADGRSLPIELKVQREAAQ